MILSSLLSSILISDPHYCWRKTKNIFALTFTLTFTFTDPRHCWCKTKNIFALTFTFLLNITFIRNLPGWEGWVGVQGWRVSRKDGLLVNSKANWIKIYLLWNIFFLIIIFLYICGIYSLYNNISLICGIFSHLSMQ